MSATGSVEIHRVQPDPDTTILICGWVCLSGNQRMSLIGYTPASWRLNSSGSIVPMTAWIDRLSPLYRGNIACSKPGCKRGVLTAPPEQMDPLPRTSIPRMIKTTQCSIWEYLRVEMLSRLATTLPGADPSPTLTGIMIDIFGSLWSSLRRRPKQPSSSGTRGSGLSRTMTVTWMMCTWAVAGRG